MATSNPNPNIPNPNSNPSPTINPSTSSNPNITNPNTHIQSTPSNNQFQNNTNNINSNPNNSRNPFKFKLANAYEKTIGVTPAQFELKDYNKTLVVTLLTSKEIIHNAINLYVLANMGITLKLNSSQTDQNSIFCVNGPSSLFNEIKDNLTLQLNTYNKDLHFLDCYVLPPKSNTQKSASFKVTVATQAMANIIMNQGFKINNINYINPTQLTRSKILNTTQCSKCQQFEHGYNACKHINHVCPHCAGDHELKSCQYKSIPAKCNNCGGSHRTTSNLCPIKKKYLIIPSTSNDINKSKTLRFNPESTYFYEAPIPTTNPWFNNNNNLNNTSSLSTPPLINNMPPSTSNTSNPPLFPTPNNPSFPIIPPPQIFSNQNHPINNSTPTSNHMQPNISYDQCLSMATKFTDWPFAFKELQKAFNMHPIIEIPSSLHGMLKPEYSTLNPNLNSQSNSPPITNLSQQPPSNQSNLPPKPATPPNSNSGSKNNFLNNKTSSNNNPTGAIPKFTSSPIKKISAKPKIQPAPSMPITHKTPSKPSYNHPLPQIPQSPNVDDPTPISQSPSNTNTNTSISSNESVDIINNSDTNSTTSQNNLVIATPNSSPPLPP